MNKPIVIFGNGQIAELAHYYFANDANKEIAAFTIDGNFIADNTFRNLPMVPFESIEKHYSPNEFDMFIALGYSNLNKLREEKYLQVIGKGYNLPGYISSKATVLCGRNNIGKNCFILEGTVIQPFSAIGNNVTLFSGCGIGHHSKICDHCFLSGHVAISGNVTVHERSYLGVNSTLRNGIIIGHSSVIGAGCWINKNINDESVCSAASAKLREEKSYELLKI